MAFIQHVHFYRQSGTSERKFITQQYLYPIFSSGPNRTSLITVYSDAHYFHAIWALTW